MGLLFAAGGALGLSPLWAGGQRRAVPGTRTIVGLRRGRPLSFVNGQPYKRPAFGTYVPEARFFRQSAEAGIDLFAFSANLGAEFGPQLWVGPDRWDFTELDAIARRALDAHPQGFLLPRIYLTAPEWWTDAQPGECQVLAGGAKTYRHGVGHGRDGRALPSIASSSWRA